jgi:elongation factor G
VEAAAAADESLLDEFLEHGAVAPERLLPALRAITLGGEVHPVLCGSALRERGIRLLLDAAVDLLPSPLDVPPVDGILPGEEKVIHRNPNPQISLAALVYKVMTDESRNRLCYTRIYSGTLRKGDRVWNPGRELEERVTRVYRMHANKKVALPEAKAGDIVALIGPKRTVTGDSLCPRDDPILLETIRFPEPVISAAIEPRSLADFPDLERALSELAVEDPTFSVRDDPDTGQKIVSGMGELHLEVLVERLSRDFNVQARTGKPQVTYRETVTRAAKATGRFDREIADRIHRAAVELAVAPNERNAGFTITNRVDPETGPPDAPLWIEQSVRDSLAAGPFAGYPLIDVQVTVTGADLPDDLATEIAVRGAAADAFQKAVAAAEVVLLEPVVRLEVTVPDEYAGEVLRDLNARHAQVTGVEPRGQLERAAALVPLANMFGYATDLRSLTRGRGTFAMELSHFEPATETMERFRSGL